MDVRRVWVMFLAVAGLLLIGGGAVAAAQPASSTSAAASVAAVRPMGTTPDGTSWAGIPCRDTRKEVNEPYPEVAVPGNYCYDPDTNIHQAWHDYCTKSPDSYHIPFVGTADFRGPCAIHDLCLNFKNGHNYCDPQLLGDLIQNCEYSFGSKNPFRYSCDSTAYDYYYVIRASTHI